MRLLVKPVRISRDREPKPFEVEAGGGTPREIIEALMPEIQKRLRSETWGLTVKLDEGSDLAGAFSINGNRFGYGRFYAIDEEQGPRPDHCCGRCPGIVGGGYDCTCEGNPRCEKWVEEAS